MSIVDEARAVADAATKLAADVEAGASAPESATPTAPPTYSAEVSVLDNGNITITLTPSDQPVNPTSAETTTVPVASGQESSGTVETPAPSPAGPDNQATQTPAGS